MILFLWRASRRGVEDKAGFSAKYMINWYLLGVRTVAAVDVVEWSVVVGPGLSTLDCGVGIGVSEGD